MQSIWMKYIIPVACQVIERYLQKYVKSDLLYNNFLSWKGMLYETHGKAAEMAVDYHSVDQEISDYKKNG